MLKLCKLVSGEAVLAEVVDADNNCIILKNPAVIGMVASGDMSMMPFPMFSSVNKDLTISLNHIVFTTPLDPNATDLINHYNQHFGNGIITPKAKSLIV